MPPRRLLAKSYASGAEPPEYALLGAHSRDVAAVCDAIAATVGPLALDRTGLGAERAAALATCLRANGWLQDLGKANSHFHLLVTEEPQVTQLLRHETISGLLASRPPLREWLAPLGELVLPAIWGAMGHHRKFDERTKPDLAAPATVYLTHPDFTAILAEMASALALAAPPRFERDLRIASTRREGGDVAARDALSDLMDEFEDREKDYASLPDRMFVALVKALGIAADVTASIVARRPGESPADFLRRSLAVGLDEDAFRRIKGQHPFAPRPFQRAVAASPSTLTLAEAGCGSGKSYAAYLWADAWRERLAAEGRHGFRLFFCLPTTGTTTEHFKDYALESGIDASLVHSRAEVDLLTIASAPPADEVAGEEGRGPADAAQAALEAARDKIEALALLSTPLVVATTDTVLGLMANGRRAIVSLPAILQSAIVFDEIHAFDDVLFGHLLMFLRCFPRLPVLLMTASLPRERLAALETVRSDLRRVQGPPDRELLERYEIPEPRSDAAAWSAVEACVSAGGKVLWIRNRVQWANEVYRVCRERFGRAIADVYHSRLRYRDRSRRHARVIARFKQPRTAAILVATQVAEMSLDLSADLLVTDIAPVPSLIQRMGRLNRRSSPEAPEPPKPALVQPLPDGEANTALPYDAEDLGRARGWLDRLRALGRPVSQRDLASAIDAASGGVVDLRAAEERALFVNGLWRTRPGTTRGDGTTISVVLQQDLDAFRATEGRSAIPKRAWCREHEVAIPFRARALEWDRDRLSYIPIAPRHEVAYDYDEATGDGTGAAWVS